MTVGKFLSSTVLVSLSLDSMKLQDIFKKFPDMERRMNLLFEEHSQEKEFWISMLPKMQSHNQWEFDNILREKEEKFISKQS